MMPTTLNVRGNHQSQPNLIPPRYISQRINAAKPSMLAHGKSPARTTRTALAFTKGYLKLHPDEYNFAHNNYIREFMCAIRSLGLANAPYLFKGSNHLTHTSAYIPIAINALGRYLAVVSRAQKWGTQTHYACHFTGRTPTSKSNITTYKKIKPYYIVSSCVCKCKHCEH